MNILPTEVFGDCPKNASDGHVGIPARANTYIDAYFIMVSLLACCGIREHTFSKIGIS